MSMAAKLTILDRSPRRSLSLPGTLRQDAIPVDIEISDLSTTGFRAATTADLDIGCEVSVGWANGGRHVAVVVREDADGHGFAFRTELDPATVASAAAVDNVVRFGTGAALGSPAISATHYTPREPIERWSGRVRLAVFAGAVTAAWGIVGSLGWAAHALAR